MATNFGGQVQSAAKVDYELAAQQQKLMEQIGTEMAANAAAQESINMGGELVSPELMRIKSAENLKTEARIQGLAAKAGFSPDLNADIQAILLSDLRDSAMKIRDTTARLEADKAVSLFEDPLTAIANAFTIPWDEQELEGLTQRRDELYKSYSDLTAGVSNAAATARSIQAKTTEATAMEQQKLVEAELARQRKAGEINVLKHNIDGVQAAMQANQRQLQYAQAYNTWQNQEENNAYQREIRDAAIADKKQKEAARLQGVEAEQRMLMLANLALAEAGRPQFKSLGEVKSKLLTQKDKQVFDDLVDKGRVLEDPKLKSLYRLGNTIQETVTFIDSVGIQGNTPDQRMIIDILRKANAEGAKQTKDKEGKVITAESYLRKTLGELEYVKKDDNTNPMRAATFGTLLDQTSVREQKAYPIIAEMVTPGNKDMSAHPQIVAPVLAKAVSDRKISPDDAARMLNAMYGASAEVNNQQNKLSQFTGLKQTKFIADIEGVDLKQSTEAAAGIVPIAAGLAATGVGIPAAAATLGVGALGLGYLGAADRRELKKIDWMDFNQTRNIMVRMSAASIIKANTAGVYPNGRADGFYPPLLIQGNQ